MPYLTDKALQDFVETIKVNVANPGKFQLFTVTNKAKKLGGKKKERYHSITSKILWIMKRSQPDLETEVYFLCTIV